LTSALGDSIADATRTATLLEAWLRGHGLQGKSLEKTLAICSEQLIESPDVLRELNKNELKEVFTQTGLRISIKKALQADAELDQKPGTITWRVTKEFVTHIAFFSAEASGDAVIIQQGIEQMAEAKASVGVNTC
jgi:hypothetical protein